MLDNITEGTVSLDSTDTQDATVDTQTQVWGVWLGNATDTSNALDAKQLQDLSNAYHILDKEGNIVHEETGLVNWHSANLRAIRQLKVYGDEEHIAVVKVVFDDDSEQEVARRTLSGKWTGPSFPVKQERVKVTKDSKIKEIKPKAAKVQVAIRAPIIRKPIPLPTKAPAAPELVDEL